MENWRDGYKNYAKTLVNANVTIKFTDSKGALNLYTFHVGDNVYASPNTLYVGTWQSDVPWQVSTPSFEKNRINLGNTIYFFCPVLYYDLKNSRVGFGFYKTELLAGETLLTNQKMYSPNRAFYLTMQEDGNLCVYRTNDNSFIWCSMVYGFNNAALVMQNDGNLVVYNGSHEPKWSSKTHPFFNSKFNNSRNTPVKLMLDNKGVLNLYNSENNIVWMSNEK